MILDQLDHWTCYFRLPAWETAMRFLAGLGPDAAFGDTEIQGRDIWAMVSGYDTCPLPESVLEAHREYVDIQAVLAGAEVQCCFPKAGLRVKTPHDPARDIEFYEHPAQYSTCWRLEPGWFSVFLPQDAHMSKGLVGAPAPVRKVVIKIRRSLLLP